MEIVLLLLVIAGLAVGYFLFSKKGKGVAASVEEHPSATVRSPSAPSPPRAAAPAPSSVATDFAPAPPPAAAPLAALAETHNVDGLREGLALSRNEGGFFGRLRSLLGGKGDITPELAADIEEALLAGDVGVKTTETILARIRDGLRSGDLKDEARVWSALRTEAVRILESAGGSERFQVSSKPMVVLMVGVNGAGKTTTIGKLAQKLTAEGHSCLLAAGDTFRAAAVQQLLVWGKRVGCEVVKGKDGADPASVIFNAIERAKQEGIDVVLADTAGRLHTKTNLMTEMEKIARTAGKALEGAPHETLLVVDATTGQNAIAQAQEFRDTLKLSGIVLTKLDGTAKGGVVLGISDALKLPVRFIGLGERADDLHEFNAKDFVEALLGRER